VFVAIIIYLFLPFVFLLFSAFSCYCIVLYLFIYLWYASSISRLHSMKWDNNWWLMNSKWLGRKWLWFNLRQCSSTCLEELRKPMKNLSQDNWSSGQDVKLKHLNTEDECCPLDCDVQFFTC
jgi:hypothetical protein